MEGGDFDRHGKSFRKIADGLALLAVLVCISAVAFNFSELPQRIPTHFDASGRADDFGSKSVLIVLPALAFLIFLLLKMAARHPGRLNYPTRITEANRERQYANAGNMLSGVNAIIQIALAYLCIHVVSVAHESSADLSPWFTPVFLISMLSVVGFFLWKGLNDR